MKYCPKCKTEVTGHRKRCPLCQGMLTDRGGESDEVFPWIPTVYRQHNLFFRILIMLSVCAAVVTAAINLMIPSGGWWSLFVLLGLGCLWTDLAFAVRKRRNIMKTIMYQVVIVSGIAVLWDVFTRWHGWSIDFVIPSVCVLAMLVFAITARVMRRPIGDYMIYLCMTALFGIVPVIFYLTGILHITWPSLSCVAVSIITLSGLTIFEGDNMLAELKRRLHL